MQVLSAKQMLQWDDFTIAHEPVESLQLMERAAMACVSFLEENDLESTTLEDVKEFTNISLFDIEFEL